MSKEEIWQELIEKHPEWATEGARFAPDTLRMFFDLVWDEATGIWVDDT